jgi:hypothetical protein
MTIKTSKNVSVRKPRSKRTPCVPEDLPVVVPEESAVVSEDLPVVVPEESAVVSEDLPVVSEDLMFELSPEEYLEESSCNLVKERPHRNEAGCYLNPLTNRYVKSGTANFKKLVKEGVIVV